MTRQVITVDIAPEEQGNRRLAVSQYDTGRPLGVRIARGGEPVDCSGYTVQLYIYKPDRTYYEAEIAADPNDSSLIIWETDEQQVAVSGACIAEIRLSEDGVSVGTANFAIWVEGSPSDLSWSSESESKSLIDLVDRAEAAADTSVASTVAAAQSAQNAQADAERAETARGAAETASESAGASATAAGQSATAAGQSASDAAGSAASASQSETAAAESASSASRSETAAGQSASSAAQSASSAGQSATSAGQSASEAVQNAEAARQSATSAFESANAAGQSASDANSNALKSEGYAVGKQNGTDVPSTSPYYQKNAKYYAEHAEQVADSIPADYSDLSNDVDDLKSALTYNSHSFIFNDYVIDTEIGKVGILSSSDFSRLNTFPAYKAMNGKNSDEEIRNDNYFFTDETGAWWKIYFPCKVHITGIKIKNSYSSLSSYLTRDFDILGDDVVLGHMTMNSAYEEKEITCDADVYTLTVQSSQGYMLGIGDFSFAYTIIDGTFVSKEVKNVENETFGFYPVASLAEKTNRGIVQITSSSIYNNSETFAPWKACDGVVDATGDGHYFYTPETGAWWKIKYPCNVEVVGVYIKNSYSTETGRLKRKFNIYTDENMQNQFGSTVIIPQTTLAQMQWAQRLVTDEPVKTDTVIIKSANDCQLGLGDVQILINNVEKAEEESTQIELTPICYEPNITGDETYTRFGDIKISSSSVFRNSSVFAAWKACDGIASGNVDGHYFFTDETGAWWKIKYPYKVHLLGLTIKNSFSTSQAYLNRNFIVYADDNMETQISDEITMTYAWEERYIETDVITDVIYIKSHANYSLGIGEVTINSDGIILNDVDSSDQEATPIGPTFSTALKANGYDGGEQREQTIYERTGFGMVYNIQLIGPTSKKPSSYLTDFDKVVLRVYTDGQLYFTGTIFELCGMGSHGHVISDYDDVVFYTPLFSKMGTRSGIMLNYKIPYYTSVRVALYYPETLETSSYIKWTLVKDTPIINISYGGRKIPYGAYLHSDKILNTSMEFGKELTLINTNKNGILMSTAMFVDSGNAYFQEGCLRGYYGATGIPQVLSSGLEDYFGFCHYFDIGLKQYPMNGLTYFSGGSDLVQTTLCAYRNHIDDPITFPSGGFLLKVRCGDSQGPVITPSDNDSLVGTAPNNTDFGAQVTYYAWDD